MIQIERELLETEKQIKKAALEAEKLSIEQQANEAVGELGAVNWVGRLLGKLLITIFHFKID